MQHLGIDLPTLIKTAGYLGIFGITFAESGLFVGFFLPGDSLLFTAGFLASQGYLSLPVLILVVFLGATLGDSFGYWFGRTVGPKIFTKEDSLLFKKEYVFRAHTFYELYGGKALLLARFMPIVRTFAPIVAGVAQMRYRSFVAYNIIGGAVWAVVLPSAAYFLGNVIPNFDQYLSYVIGGIIILSVLPSIIHLLKNRSHSSTSVDKTL
jgi:membrane-associated protein